MGTRLKDVWVDRTVTELEEGDVIQHPETGGELTVTAVRATDRGQDGVRYQLTAQGKWGRIDWRRLAAGETLSRQEQVAVAWPATPTHVHIAIDSRDCDGPHERSYTERQSDYLLTLLRIYGAHNDMRVRADEDGLLSVEWGGPTDEGYHREEARECADPYCENEPARQRDVFAERRGY